MASVIVEVGKSRRALDGFLDLVGEPADTMLPADQSPRFEFDWNGSTTALVTYTKTVEVDAGKASRYLAGITGQTAPEPPRAPRHVQRT